jgi:hypothetical protein
MCSLGAAPDAGSAMITATLKGKLPGALADDIAAAIEKACQQGMRVDEASCVVVAVAADHARRAYGDGYLPSLAKIIEMQAGKPLPRR